MSIKTGSSFDSALEFEAAKKIPRWKEIEAMIDSSSISDTDIRKMETKIIDLLSFYDNLIKNIGGNLSTLSKHAKADKTKVMEMEKDLYLASKEKIRFKKLLTQLKNKRK